MTTILSPALLGHEIWVYESKDSSPWSDRHVSNRQFGPMQYKLAAERKRNVHFQSRIQGWRVTFSLKHNLRTLCSDCYSGVHLCTDMLDHCDGRRGHSSCATQAPTPHSSTLGDANRASEFELSCGGADYRISISNWPCCFKNALFKSSLSSDADPQLDVSSLPSAQTNKPQIRDREFKFTGAAIGAHDPTTSSCLSATPNRS